MSRLRGRRQAMILVCALAMLTLFFSQSIAGDPPSPWSWRVDLVWITPDSDFDPIDNLFGASLNALYDLGSNIRIGGEFQWATGDGDSAGESHDTDWWTIMAVGEYSFMDPSESDYEIYANLGVGVIFVDEKVSELGFSGSEDDTSIAIRPAVGGNIFFTENVGLNLQAGYLWSEVNFGGGDKTAGGLELKIGATVRY